MVGFQTRMTIGEQKRVLRLIPGMEHAEFLRYGSIHRNTYVNSPSILAQDLSLKKNASVFLAGQICGSEGYTESIATGHLAALFVWAKLAGHTLTFLPATTACGALLKHITLSKDRAFTPSNINFGLMEPVEIRRRIGREEKNGLICERALYDMKKWIKENLDTLI